LDSLQVMMKGASLAVAAERGVRVISDYLPPQISRREEYERIFELERKLGSRPEFAAVARYIQIIARHSNGHRARGRDNDTGRRQSASHSAVVRPAAIGDLRWASGSPTSATGVFLLLPRSGAD